MSTETPEAPSCLVCGYFRELNITGPDGNGVCLDCVVGARALHRAVLDGWRREDALGLLRGCARYANGRPVAVCQQCRKPEYEDGLIATEVIEPGIVGGFLCPQCKSEP